MRKALLVIDCQNDFVSGSLAVTNAAAICNRIANYIELHATEYVVTIASQDWHIDPAEHFSADADYQNSWPPHCVAYSEGAYLHYAITQVPIDIVVRKGAYEAAYSIFDAFALDGTPFNAVLTDLRIDTIDIVGIATDYCVKQSALDSSKLFKTTVFLQLCAAVSADTEAAAIEQMQQAGVVLK